MSILSLLAARQRQNRQASQQSLVSAVVISGGFGRYKLNDGSQVVEAETIVREQLKPGDRVWLTRGRGVSVIVGLHGRDVTAAENE